MAVHANTSYVNMYHICMHHLDMITEIVHHLRPTYCSTAAITLYLHRKKKLYLCSDRRDFHVCCRSRLVDDDAYVNGKNQICRVVGYLHGTLQFSSSSSSSLSFICLQIAKVHNGKQDIARGRSGPTRLMPISACESCGGGPKGRIP